MKAIQLVVKPNYMRWQLAVVIHENVVVKALKALEQYPTPKSRQALTSTIENEKCFYSIRIDAAKSLAKVAVSHCCRISCIVAVVVFCFCWFYSKIVSVEFPCNFLLDFWWSASRLRNLFIFYFIYHCKNVLHECSKIKCYRILIGMFCSGESHYGRVAGTLG